MPQRVLESAGEDCPGANYVPGRMHLGMPFGQNHSSCLSKVCRGQVPPIPQTQSNISLRYDPLFSHSNTRSGSGICRRIVIPIFLIAISVSCGAPGAPLPPSLYLPQPVTDLKAERKGESVTLSWTAPTRTTDHLPVRVQGMTDICRAEQSLMVACGVPVGNIPSEVSDVAKTQKFVDTLPEKFLTNDATTDIAYSVDARNSNGRSAGLSNQVRVPAIRTPSAPSGLQVRATSDGLQVIWNAVSLPMSASGLNYFYRIFRREDGKAAATVAGELPLSDSEPVFVDHNFEWEKSYDYRVTRGYCYFRKRRSKAMIRPK